MPLPAFLQWFPVIYKFQYMILVCVYKVIHGTAPQYLEELVIAHHPTISLKSESETLLTVPQRHSAMYGCRCFGTSAATLWNNLLINIRKWCSLISSSWKSLVKGERFIRGKDTCLTMSNNLNSFSATKRKSEEGWQTCRRTKCESHSPRAYNTGLLDPPVQHERIVAVVNGTSRNTLATLLVSIISLEI